MTVGCLSHAVEIEPGVWLSVTAPANHQINEVFNRCPTAAEMCQKLQALVDVSVNANKGTNYADLKKSAAVFGCEAKEMIEMPAPTTVCFSSSPYAES